MTITSQYNNILWMIWFQSVNARPYELILQKDNTRLFNGCDTGTDTHTIPACIQPEEEATLENSQVCIHSRIPKYVQHVYL